MFGVGYYRTGQEMWGWMTMADGSSLLMLPTDMH